MTHEHCYAIAHYSEVKTEQSTQTNKNAHYIHTHNALT